MRLSLSSRGAEDGLKHCTLLIKPDSSATNSGAAAAMEYWHSFSKKLSIAYSVLRFERLMAQLKQFVCLIRSSVAKNYLCKIILIFFEVACNLLPLGLIYPIQTNK